VDFVDGEGNIVVPKPVRPILELKPTSLGGKKVATRQFRYGKLHIRDYDTHYTVHMDRVDPLKNPLGHLIVDAPEYLAGGVAAFVVARHIGSAVYKTRKKEGSTGSEAAIDAAIAAYIAGSSAAKLIYDATNSLKKKRGA